MKRRRKTTPPKREKKEEPKEPKKKKKQELKGLKETAKMSTVREATHAGTWYIGNPEKLKKDIDEAIAATPEEKRNKARVIIGPHAGYMYCGSTMGQSYGALNVGGDSPVNTVFVLGPNHFAPNNTCAITSFKSVATPFGDIPVNEKIVNDLLATKMFEYMDVDVDLEEHSLEMHMPFLHRKFGGAPFTVVPIAVGSFGIEKIREYGKIFAKYITDPTCAFAISSDFCHWGIRYGYTYLDKEWMKDGVISDSIKTLDLLAAEKIAVMDIQGYVDYDKKYKSPICGKRAILITMSAMEAAGLKPKGEVAHYSQSDRVTQVFEFAVGYCAITFAF